MSRKEPEPAREKRARNEAPRVGPSNGPGGNGRETFESETRAATGPAPAGVRHDTRHDESVPGLVKRLAYDLSTLFSQELALAKAEISSTISDVRTGLSTVATGAFVLYAGFLFLLGGVTMLLTYWVTLPVSALIVGGIVAIIGGIMLQGGRRNLAKEHLKPARTVHSFKEDARVAKRRGT